MQKGILDEKTGHEWDKQNLVTKHDKDGTYDVWYCVHCKNTFKRRGVSWHPLQTICKMHAPNIASTGLAPQAGASEDVTEGASR